MTATHIFYNCNNYIYLRNLKNCLSNTYKLIIKNFRKFVTNNILVLGYDTRYFYSVGNYLCMPGVQFYLITFCGLYNRFLIKFAGIIKIQIMTNKRNLVVFFSTLSKYRENILFTFDDIFSVLKRTVVIPVIAIDVSRKYVTGLCMLSTLTLHLFTRLLHHSAVKL